MDVRAIRLDAAGGRAAYGIKPAIIAVVLQALWGLGRTAIKSRILAAIAIISLVGSLLDVNDMIVLLGGGIVMLASRAVQDRAGDRSDSVSREFGVARDRRRTDRPRDECVALISQCYLGHIR